MHAYQQLKFSEDSQNYIIINTHRGLYRYTRLPLGVAAIRISESNSTTLQGLPKVICYLDDILVSGSTEEENLKNAEHVLLRLKQYGVKAKKAKCVFSTRQWNIWVIGWMLQAWTH